MPPRLTALVSKSSGLLTILRTYHRRLPARRLILPTHLEFHLVTSASLGTFLTLAQRTNLSPKQQAFCARRKVSETPYNGLSLSEPCQT